MPSSGKVFFCFIRIVPLPFNPFIMKQLLILCLLLPIASEAQIEFRDIAGKWQEQSRTTSKGKEKSFTDTLRLEIRPDGFMMIRHTVGPTLTGQAELKGQKIYLQDEKIIIVESTAEKLVLCDQEGNHVYSRLPEFTSAPVKKLVPGVEEGVKDLSPGKLIGNWSVYKKTDPAFKGSTFYLKRLIISAARENNSFSGQATYNNNDSVYNKDVLIRVNGNEALEVSGEENLRARVMKSDGDELILQSGNVHYFLKQLGK